LENAANGALRLLATGWDLFSLLEFHLFGLEPFAEFVELFAAELALHHREHLVLLFLNVMTGVLDEYLHFRLALIGRGRSRDLLEELLHLSVFLESLLGYIGKRFVAFRDQRRVKDLFLDVCVRVEFVLDLFEERRMF